MSADKRYSSRLEGIARDISAGLVVFLVAVPLCLGVALASGMPFSSGLLAGIVGGLVVSWASGSALSVSGPAAGLTVIVFSAITTLGSLERFALATVMAGLFQWLLGYLGAGVIAAFFPVSVIRGMLAAIGLVLIMKQLPHAAGYDADYEGDESFFQGDAHTTFSEIFYSLGALSPTAMLISMISLIILVSWDRGWRQRQPYLRYLPGPLVVVLAGVGLHHAVGVYLPQYALQPEHLVNLPVFERPFDFFRSIHLPDWSGLREWPVYQVAFTLAIVASIETLLSVEAVDRIDPKRRVTPPNRELKAQGLGNFLSGMLGGLPITSVIVRSSANVNAGADSRLSSFTHGVLLVISTLFLAEQLNHIPLSSLAAILLQTGYKLCHPGLWQAIYRKGKSQFAPFAITVVAILLTDLLKGMMVGMLVGLYFVIRTNFVAAISLTRHQENYLLKLRKDVSFLNKSLLRNLLSDVEPGSYLIVDGSRANFVDSDIRDTLLEFCQSAPERQIEVELRNLTLS